MKGVILAGGFGTRMLESTKTINKHLLPIYSKDGAHPMIFYPINTLINSGVTDILIITSDESAGLMIETLGDGKKFGKNIDFTYKIQNMHDKNNPIGIASAMKLIEKWLHPLECFAVILGDNFYEETFTNEFKEFEENTIKNSFSSSFSDFIFAHTFIHKVSDPERFGVATLDNNNKIINIEEKPKNPKTNFAVTGLYLYNTSVFDIIKNLKVSNRGELEVSHVNQFYVENNSLSSSMIKKMWSDMGTPESMLKTINHINENNFKLNFNKGNNGESI
jgi:glucose-1-phosphate thymidylyltransferase